MLTYGLTNRKPNRTSIFDTIDELFSNSMNSTLNSKLDDYKYESRDWTFKSTDTGGELTLSALGHKPEDIEITLTDSILKIKSDKPEGSPSIVSDLDYSFTVNSKYSSDDVKASFDNGMVTISFGFKEESKPKRIEISYN